MPKTKHEYGDDIFADSRMSFGDHIEELRVRLWRAIKGVLLILIGGVILDFAGESLGLPWLGLGRPMLKVIKEPVEEQAKEFYYRRNESLSGRANEVPRASPEEVARVKQKLADSGNNLAALSADERLVLLGSPEWLSLVIDVAQLEPVFGPPKDPGVKELELKAKVFPGQINYLNIRGETLLGSKQYVTTLSVQEPFVAYFKVALLCSFVLASPWVFYQVWAFVAAGLYPHERRHVHVYLPASVGLFLVGVGLCQFFVMPGAVRALLGFNAWLDLDPDVRFNEWLGFAIILPLVFGLSFQTPLVMLFLNRIGVFGYADYLSKWRYAIIVLAVFAAVITPTPDAVTMLYLFLPMFSLYLVGIAVCYLFPNAAADEDEVAAEEIAV